jgi:hypothetical protein
MKLEELRGANWVPENLTCSSLVPRINDWNWQNVIFAFLVRYRKRMRWCHYIMKVKLFRSWEGFFNSVQFPLCKCALLLWLCRYETQTPITPLTSYFQDLWLQSLLMHPRPSFSEHLLPLSLSGHTIFGTSIKLPYMFLLYLFIQAADETTHATQHVIYSNKKREWAQCFYLISHFATFNTLLFCRI